jgi:hypothetical protein
MKSPAQVLCVVATLLLPTLPAFAQSANDSSAGPIFSIPNFTGDARSDDLYVYMHEQPHEAWNTYQERLRAAARAVQNQQPLQLSPTPESAGSGTAAMLNTINTATGAARQDAHVQQQQQAAVASQAQAQQPQVTTSVSGAVLSGPVPGLVDP